MTLSANTNCHPSHDSIKAIHHFRNSIFHLRSMLQLMTCFEMKELHLEKVNANENKSNILMKYLPKERLNDGIFAFTCKYKSF